MDNRLHTRRILTIVGIGALLISSELLVFRSLDRSLSGFALGMGTLFQRGSVVVDIVSAASTLTPHPAAANARSQSGVALPMVASAQVPLYPPVARVANVEGVVHVKVTTDGCRVVSTQVEDGNKLLAAAAEDNAKTWQFSLHEPVTFTVTYTYKLLTTEWKGNPNNPIVVLRFPTEVEVATLRRVEHNQ